MRYHTPESFEDAFCHCSGGLWHDTFLAGGTDVLVQLRSDMVEPDDLIDIKHIAGVKEIAQTADGGWRIGAGVPSAEMMEHAGLSAAWPGVVEAADLIGSTQIQARCTLVGTCATGPRRRIRCLR